MIRSCFPSNHDYHYSSNSHSTASSRNQGKSIQQGKKSRQVDRRREQVMAKASSSTSASSCTSFPVDSTLLHPTFESYRLVQPQDPENESLIQSYHPLPSQLSLSQISNPSGSILGHKDAKDRSRFSHLIPKMQSDEEDQDTNGSAMAAYVDLQGFLMLIVVDEVSTVESRRRIK